MLELLASEYRLIAQDVLTYSIFAAALIWGAGPERAVIATWIVVFEIFPIPYEAFVADGYQLEATDVFLASAELCAAMAWTMIALYANRNYPLLVAGLQLLALASHVARGMLEAISPVAYATMFIVPGWLQLIVMVIGLWRHAKREREFGPYREWRVPIPWLDWLSTRIGKT